MTRAAAARSDRGAPPHVQALVDDLVGLLGADGVSVEESVRVARSTDWAHMSPVLSARLPAGLADVVAFPSCAAEVASVVGLAHRHGVPITPRGQGTGNYGQAIPLSDGLVLDLSKCTAVLSVDAGSITAEAGAAFVTLEAAAAATGQELAILPSTVGSTIGGFIAGGAGGTGSVENGWTWDGYVRALSVVPCVSDPAPVEVRYPDTVPMTHAYGTTGVIATATVQLVPARDWTGLYTSFPSLDLAVAAGRAIMRLDPPPRLVSVDEADLVALLGRDPAMPAGRTSLRAIVDTSVLDDARRMVDGSGGVVEAVRPRGPAHLTSLSFNHITHRARKAVDGLAHLQVGGEAVVNRPEEVRACFSDTLVHLDGFRTGPVDARGYGGMLLCRYEGADRLYAGMARLAALGVEVDDPHTWLLRHGLPEIRAAAARFDPDGLLNPGKIPPP